MSEATKLGAWDEDEYFLLQCVGWTCDYWVAFAHFLPICPSAPVAVRASCDPGLYFYHLSGSPATLILSSIPYRGLLLYEEDKPCPVCPLPALQCSPFFPETKITSKVCHRAFTLLCQRQDVLSQGSTQELACMQAQERPLEPGPCVPAPKGLAVSH